jgi:hypothetical protein
MAIPTRLIPRRPRIRLRVYGVHWLKSPKPAGGIHCKLPFLVIRLHIFSISADFIV